MSRESFHHALKVVEEKCIGCTHCMLTCPTEAIRVFGGKAHVDPDRCVDCGNCMSVCPVDAIVVEQDDFQQIYHYTHRVAVVPSVMIGQFNENIAEQQIFSVLLEMGFTDVYEAEYGIDILHNISGRYTTYAARKPVISSFCPAIIRLIQVRFPSLVGQINLLKPPLDITASYIRQKLESEGKSPREIGIFYVTPCAAKIAAIKKPVGESKSGFDGVINMDFLYNLIHRNLIKQRQRNDCTIPRARKISPAAVLWSLTTGESRHIGGRNLAVDGIHNVMEFLEKLENEEISGIDFLELRACDEGCAGGILGSGNRFLTAERLRHRAEQIKKAPPVKEEAVPERIADFLRETIKLETIEPRSIMKLDDNPARAMEKMDTLRQIMETLPMVDCGLCGAPNCEALAMDAAQGSAEVQRCIFLQRRQEVIDSSNVAQGLAAIRKIWGRGKIE
jgi:iron only hydrogenase large subunit-like protein